jgi:hypothetical protein
MNHDKAAYVGCIFTVNHKLCTQIHTQVLTHKWEVPGRDCRLDPQRLHQSVGVVGHVSGQHLACDLVSPPEKNWL